MVALQKIEDPEQKAEVVVDLLLPVQAVELDEGGDLRIEVAPVDVGLVLPAGVHVTLYGLLRIPVTGMQDGQEVVHLRRPLEVLQDEHRGGVALGGHVRDGGIVVLVRAKDLHGLVIIHVAQQLDALHISLVELGRMDRVLDHALPRQVELEIHHAKGCVQAVNEEMVVVVTLHPRLALVLVADSLVGEIPLLLLVRQAVLVPDQAVQQLPVLGHAPGDETDAGDGRPRRDDIALLVDGETALAGDLPPVVVHEILEVTDHGLAPPLGEGAVGGPGTLGGGVRGDHDAVQVIDLVAQEVREVVLHETNLLVVVGEVQPDLGPALGELDAVGGIRLRPALDDAGEVMLRGVRKRGDGADIEGQRLAPGNGIDLLVLLIDASRQEDVHLAELGTGIDRLDVVVDEIAVDILDNRIETDALRDDRCLHVTAEHLVAVAQPPGIPSLRKRICIVLDSLLLRDSVVTEEHLVRHLGGVGLESEHIGDVPG